LLKISYQRIRVRFSSVAGDNVPGDTLNINVGAENVRAIFIISPSLTLIPGSKIDSNNPSAMLVGYDIANPPGYAHNALIRLGQSVTAIMREHIGIL